MLASQTRLPTQDETADRSHKLPHFKPISARLDVDNAATDHQTQVAKPGKASTTSTTTAATATTAPSKKHQNQSTSAWLVLLLSGLATVVFISSVVASAQPTSDGHGQKPDYLAALFARFASVLPPSSADALDASLLADFAKQASTHLAAWTDAIHHFALAPMAAFAPLFAQSRTRVGLRLHTLSGSLLEIGPGTGSNAPLFSPSLVSSITLLEPNAFMNASLVAAFLRVVNTGIMDGSSIVPKASINAVVGTLVLCSVPSDQLASSIALIHDWLKPGGEYLFVEHVAAEHGKWTHTAQRFAAPLFYTFGGGCNLQQETGPRFSVEIRGSVEGMQPIIWGRAVKRSAPTQTATSIVGTSK
ncbi:hypothetical protein BC831DRAFT_463910, partial [Entophlyctis helioformis]